MQDTAVKQGRYEKAAAGWWNGCNSNRVPWLLKDSQYIWGENVACRGGIVQTRPSRILRMSLPAGERLQGGKVIKINKETAISTGYFLVFAVDGLVYSVPIEKVFPDNHVTDWNLYKLPIQFSRLAKRVYFEVAKKSASTTSEGTIQIVKSYNVLMMQDGSGTAAAYYDGEFAQHTIQDAPYNQTPSGSWMKWIAQRLCVAVGDRVLIGDLADPLSFNERLASAAGGGDFIFDDDITGMTVAIGDNRQTNLIVFTENDGSLLLVSILDRETWGSTANFKTTIFPSVGCVSGDSITTHSGILWWYSHGGLVNSDSAAAAYLTSEIKYQDVEMAHTKRNLNVDMSGICAFSFESYLGMSVPYGDDLNAQTMILDSSISSESGSTDERPAWNGVWTGVRPVSWIPVKIDGIQRLFCLSVDYQALNNETTFFHLWEEFQPERTDVYYEQGLANEILRKTNRIYCSVMFKPLGDGLDIKRFAWAEADLCEIGGEVDVKVSFSGTMGAFKEIKRQKIIATTDAEGASNPDVQAIYNAVGPFALQRRRIKTEEFTNDESCNRVEFDMLPNYDKAFSLLFQWCGRMGIESYRIFSDAVTESSVGACAADESGYNILTPSGQSFHLEEQ